MTAQRTAVVVMYDVRAFSSAARRVPEEKLSAFMTSAHALILSFLDVPRPAFTKNLGDGTLLLYAVDEKKARAILPGLVEGCVTGAREFRGLAERQRFKGADKLPRELGFGVTFGTVTRGDDWYGNAINLAARLTDRARPRGVVLDEATFRLLEKKPREPIYARRRTLKGLGSVRFHQIARLTTGERVRMRVGQIATYAVPVLVPLVAFGWIDAGLPFPGGSTARGAIDAMGASVLRRAEDISEIDRRAEAVRAQTAVGLATRFDRATGRVRPGAGRSTEFFAAADGMTLTALASGSPRGVGPRLRRNVDRLFAGQRLAGGRRLTELLEGRGFVRDPTEPYPHGETTAWVLLGLVHAHEHPAFRRPAARRALDRNTARTWSALRGFFDPICGAWHWRRDQAARNVYGRPQLDNVHYASAYTAALVVWAMAEASRIGVSLDGSGQLLRATVAWLVEHFDASARGWSPQYTTDARDSQDVDHGALTMQIYAVLQLVELWAPEALPDGGYPEELTEAMQAAIRDLPEETELHPTAEHHWTVEVAGERSRPRRVRDARTFHALPWAYAAARLHHDLHTANEREKNETRSVVTALLEHIEERAAAASPHEDLLELDELCAALALAARRPR